MSGVYALTFKPKPVYLDNVVDNNLTRTILSQFPSGRNSRYDEEIGSCPILMVNNSLEALVPGWEGIPSNIAINIVLSAVLMFGFSLLIRKVYATERLIKAEYIAYERSSDWIHFIYGKRGSKQLATPIKAINRDHPNAYLPLILHNHRHLIKGSVEGKEENKPQDFERNLYGSDANEMKSADNKSINYETPTLRTKSESFRGLDAEEEQQVAHLKSILFEDSFTKSASTSTQDIPQAGPAFSDSKSLRQWISRYMYIKDIDIYNRRGYDALQYLVFQRYLIYFLFALSIICVFIILPVNIYGGKLNNFTAYYRRTTILNIRKDSPIIYIHSIMTLFLVAMGIFLMKNFTNLIGERVKSIDRKTLLIENIPKLKRNPKELKEFLEKKFPNVVVKRISFVYNVNKLTSLYMSLWTSIEAKSYCRVYHRKYGQRLEVRPYLLGNFRGLFGCCYCNPKMDGLNYYTEEKKELEKDIKVELTRTTGNPSRMAFVVFEHQFMTKKVHKYFKQKQCHFYSVSTFIQWIFGHESDPFNSWQWKIAFAPYPDDVNWPEMGLEKWKERTMIISMNLLIVIVFLFLSTPGSALRVVRYFTAKLDEDNNPLKSDPILAIFWSYVPTLSLSIMTGILPALIKVLTTLMPYQTKSDFNHGIMYKSYFFLILMVLILPSLQIITVSQLFESQLKVNETGEARELRWSCLFPAENGAFFLNYVLTSAFVGNTLEVIRISELAAYMACLLLVSRTTAEYLTARQLVKFEFYFGTYYPRILLLFTLVVTFSISNPVIAPIGLFYLGMKHMVDRYLIFHVYVPTKISQRVHSKAVVFVYFALLFLLLQMNTHLSSMYFYIPSYIVGLCLFLYFLFALFEFIRDIVYYNI